MKQAFYTLATVYLVAGMILYGLRMNEIRAQIAEVKDADVGKQTAICDVYNNEIVRNCRWYEVR